jgi:hypothetical protein
MRGNKNDCFETKRLASYSSHSGTTAKMWILPNGKAVSIPGQHSEWALGNEDYLKRRFAINLRYVRSRGDTAIRLHLLRHGCVRLNYEHKGGRLTVEAHHLHWGAQQIRGCLAVIRDNLTDISFVLIRLLNNRFLIMEEEVANLVGCPIATAMRKLKLLPQFRRPA